MSLYELLLLLHISAVVIWLGAGFLIAVLVFGAERAGDRMREAAYHRDVGWLAPRLFIPSALATLVLGVLLVVDGERSFGELWIVIALVGWAISFALGFFYFRPEGERIGAMVAERGPDDPEAGFRVRRLNVVDRLQVTILFVVLADMVLKPAGEDTGLLLAGAVVLAAATAMSVAAIGRASSSPEQAHGGG